VAKGSGGRPIVVDDDDRKAYLARFHAEAAQRGWIVHASCLLDTHHHAVVTTPAPDLGIGTGRVLGGHAAWFNQRHGRDGAVFAERFWSRRAEGHVVRAVVYSLVNPVAAGLVQHPREWAWSSYHRLVAEGCTPLLASCTGGASELLALIEDAVEGIHARHARDGRSTWVVVGAIVPPTRAAEGRG
jgi:putative transposase